MKYGTLIIKGTGAASSDADGYFYYDSNLEKFQFREAGAWKDIGGGGANTRLSNLDTILGTAINTGLMFSSIDDDPGAVRYINIAQQGTTNYAGNSIGITAAQGNGNGVGGNAFITSGRGGDNADGGFVQIKGGNGGTTTGKGGDVYITSGEASTEGDSGDIYISSYNAVGTDKSSGDIKLNIGTPTGAGVRGSITINDSYSLPNANGTDGYVLTCHGDGIATWDAASGGQTLAQTLALGNGTNGNDIYFTTDGDVILDASATSIDPYNRRLYASDGTTVNLNWATADYVYISDNGGYIRDQSGSDLVLGGLTYVYSDPPFIASDGIYDTSGPTISIDTNNRKLYAPDGTTNIIDWTNSESGSAYLSFSSVNVSGEPTTQIHTHVEMETGKVIAAVGMTSIDPEDRVLYASDGTTANLNWATANIVYTENIQPSTDSSKNLGDASNAWLAIYGDGGYYGTVYSDNYSDYTFSNTIVSRPTASPTVAWIFNADLVPSADGARSLGSSGERWKNAFFISSFGSAEPNLFTILGEESAYALHFDNDGHEMWMFDTNQGGYAIGWNNKATSDAFMLGDSPTTESMARFTHNGSSDVFLAVDSATHGTYGIKVTQTTGTGGYFTDGARTVTVCENSSLYGLTVGDADYTIRMADNANNYAAILQDTGGADTVIIADGSYGVKATRSGAYVGYLGSANWAVRGEDTGATHFGMLCDATYGGVFQYSSVLVNLASSTTAGYFTDGTRTSNICDGTYAGVFSDGSYVVHLSSSTNAYALKAEDGTRGAYLADGTYAINAQGDVNIGSGDLKMGATTVIDSGGFFRPVTSTDASAPNNSIYYSSTQSKLVYKDSGGTVNTLY